MKRGLNTEAIRVLCASSIHFGDLRSSTAHYPPFTLHSSLSSRSAYHRLQLLSTRVDKLRAQIRAKPLPANDLRGTQRAHIAHRVFRKIFSSP